MECSVSWRSLSVLEGTCHPPPPLPGLLVVNISNKLKWESLNEFDPEHMCAKHESFGDLLCVNISKMHVCFHCR